MKWDHTFTNESVLFCFCMTDLFADAWGEVYTHVVSLCDIALNEHLWCRGLVPSIKPCFVFVWSVLGHIYLTDRLVKWSDLPMAAQEDSGRHRSKSGKTWLPFSFLIFTLYCQLSVYQELISNNLWLKRADTLSVMRCFSVFSIVQNSAVLHLFSFT